MHMMNELLTSRINESAPFTSADQDEASAQLLATRAGDRALPDLGINEPRRDRAVWIGLLLVVLAMYAFALRTFWAPADGGIDQNAYLVGGKQLALTGSTRLQPANPFGYVGHMLIVPENGSGDAFYPKYPIGLSALFALAIKLTSWGNWARGEAFAFAVSPTCTVLAVAGVFFLARTVAGSFPALLAAIALATCEVMWALANVSNSHASCVAFVVWGMFFLVTWWQSGSIWRGVLAGFLLGFACLIRYTEGLLILPIALAVIFRLRFRDWRSYLRNATPALAWAVPVGFQLIYNRATIGHWTGYDSSNESEFGAAFTWGKFIETWEQVLRTFHDQGLFFLLPLGVAGLVMLFSRGWELAVVMLAWLLPGTLLYTSYYWSPDRGVAYARFFLTFFPALLVGMAVCMRVWSESGRTRIAATLASGLIVAVAAGVSTYRVLQPSEGGPGGGGGMSESLPAQFRARLQLATAGDILLKNVAPGAVVFADEGRMINGPLNYLQFAGRDWQMFSTDAFSFRGMRGGGGMRMGMRDGDNADNPTPMQPERRKLMAAQYANMSDKDLVAAHNQIVDEALRSGHKVYVFATTASVDSFENRFLPSKKYRLVTVQWWKDMPEPTGAGDSRGTSRTAFNGRRRGFGGPGGGFGGGPGPGGRGGFGPPGGGPFGGEDVNVQNQWSLVEITYQPEPSTTTKPVPTTAPVAQR